MEIHKLRLIFPQTQTLHTNLLFQKSCSFLTIFNHRPFCQAIVINCKFCSRRRCRCPKIRHIISDCRVCLMSDCGNHRCITFKNRSCNCFFVKRPQIFDRSASTSNNHYIYAICIQCLYSCNNTLHCTFALHKRRIQDQLYKWIPPRRNIHNIPDCCTGRCRYHADCLRICRNLLLILRGKHPHLFQLFL